MSLTLPPGGHGGLPLDSARATGPGDAAVDGAVRQDDNVYKAVRHTVEGGRIILMHPFNAQQDQPRGPRKQAPCDSPSVMS